ncbi:tubulin-specific chaperone E [Rhodotorula toruloides]|uniref:Tubulin-specific chaperone E n=1 Tax=Rhodotorula toruloides TaxID=5286 RepID=A0A511KB49_RHOTO|nr:tubulin-specific chaperone E [Rhodotorula toruloides]
MLHKRVCYSPPAPPSSSSSSANTACPTPQLGTILYHGPVPPTKGDWYGIEWDEPARGKHNGVYDKTGVRYFVPRVEGSGSFLRPDAKGLDVEGKTFSQALHDRYLDYGLPTSSQSTDTAASASRESQATIPTQRFATDSNFDVEVVLNDRVNERFRQLGRLREVGLEWEGVSCAVRRGATDEGFEEEEEEEEELRDLGRELKNLEVLNVSFSLLPTLPEASRFAAVLPKLRSLALNSNRFILMASPTSLPGFERLTSLQLNNTLMTWSETRCISPSLPNLVDLQFGFNRLGHLGDADHAGRGRQVQSIMMPNLKRLNMESNELEDWVDVVSELSCLPSLEELYLSSNRINSLVIPQVPVGPTTATSTSPSPPRLTRLRHLSLSENLLDSSATSVDALAACRESTFPTLTSLRLSGNPLFESRASTTTKATDTQAVPPAEERHLLHSRLLIVARLPFLIELEKTAVSQAERNDAERLWVEQIAQGKEREVDLSEWAKGRLAELRLKWSDVAGSIDSNGPAGATKDAKPTLKDRLIRLSVRADPSLLPAPSATLPELSVLPSLRTLLLRTQISRLIGKPLPKTKYRLVAVLKAGTDVRGEKGDEVRVEISPAEEGKEVSWWGLEAGDAVEVVAT